MDGLWIDFVNSDWHDYLGREPDRDRLAEPAWVGRWLEAWRLPRFDTGCRETRAALRGLRDLLRRVALTLVDDRPLEQPDLDALNAYLEARPVTSRIEVADDAFHLRLTPVAEGLDAALYAIARSFASFLVDGDPHRLKICENPDCQWVFYDTTRSRTRRWCAESCGNLMKVRKFREKQKRRKA
jgi:predicted RNA-binding Zn ribbon-like protein